MEPNKKKEVNELEGLTDAVKELTKAITGVVKDVNDLKTEVHKFRVAGKF